MLVAQAKRAAELFTGSAIEAEAVDRIMQQLARQMQNIILIGMPGCGKSTLGKALAEHLDRPFYDADTVLEAQTGRTIPEIFRSEGEATFRRLETDVLAQLGKLSGTVIATGGGCVTRQENYAHLQQNGRLIWLQRPLEDLPVAGRPLSQTTNCQNMYAQRRALYASFADATVQNDTEQAQVLHRLLEEVQ